MTFQSVVRDDQATKALQFMHAFLSGYVNDLTAARKIDTLVGITTQGRWEDEEIVDLKGAAA